MLRCSTRYKLRGCCARVCCGMCLCFALLCFAVFMGSFSRGGGWYLSHSPRPAPNPPSGGCDVITPRLDLAPPPSRFHHYQIVYVSHAFGAHSTGQSCALCICFVFVDYVCFAFGLWVVDVCVFCLLALKAVSCPQFPIVINSRRQTDLL